MSSKESVFSGKVALVTGGVAGIGRGVVEALAAQGAIVYAADINADGLASMTGLSDRIVPTRLDVTRQADFRQVIDRVVEAHGRLDIIVNNAGMGLAGDFNATSMPEIETVTAVNYWSVIYGTKLAYAQMVKQGHGHIVNVSSSGGAMPVPNQTMYSSIKHAVLGLSHSLREEAALRGVKVSAVLPGMVKSELWDTAVNVKDYNLKENMESTGLKPVTAAEAAEAILKGIAANDRSIIFPRINKVILTLYRLAPGLMTRLAVTPLASK